MDGVVRKSNLGLVAYTGRFPDGGQFRVYYDVESGHVWVRADANTSVFSRKGSFAVVQPCSGNFVVREFVQAGAVYTLTAKFRKCLLVPASGGKFDAFDLLTDVVLRRDGERVGWEYSDLKIILSFGDAGWVHSVPGYPHEFVVDSRDKEVGPVRRCGVSVRLIVSPEVAGGVPLIEDFECAFIIRQQENIMCEHPLHLQYTGPCVWPCGGGCIDISKHLEWWYYREWTSGATERLVEEGRLLFRQTSIGNGWTLSDSGVACTEGGRVYDDLHVEVELSIPSRHVRYISKQGKGRQVDVYKVRSLGNFVVAPNALFEVLPGREFKVYTGEGSYMVIDSVVLKLTLHPSGCAFGDFVLNDGSRFVAKSSSAFKVFVGVPACDCSVEDVEFDSVSDSDLG